MRILVIMGSPRRGNTYHAVERIEEHLRSRAESSGGVSFTYLMLGEMDLSHCRGCFACFEKGEEHCPLEDDAEEIDRQMQDADAVIFATPVYGMNVSGLFTTFVDRFSYIFHRPRFFDKKALLVTTAALIGHKEVLKYMDLVARIWGFEVVHRTAVIIPPLKTLPASLAEENEKNLAEAADALYRAMQTTKRRSPSLSDVLLFRGQRGTFDELGELSPVDYQYWKDRGWLEKKTKYFVDVPVNPLYNLIGAVMEWYARRKTRRLVEEISEAG